MLTEKMPHITRKYLETMYKQIVKSMDPKMKAPLLYRNKSTLSVHGLCFLFFAMNKRKIMTKKQLLLFLKDCKCESIDPQPRHLGMQKGFDFLVQGCYHPYARRALKQGEYSLLSLKKCSPTLCKETNKVNHRIKTLTRDDFLKIKIRHSYRCVVCGSKENEFHLKNGRLITKLQMGHCDPSKSLTNTNCIPICSICNQVYKNKVIFNHNGYVTSFL